MFSTDSIDEFRICDFGFGIAADSGYFRIPDSRFQIPDSRPIPDSKSTPPH
ncbi:MAG: hypothetical protein IPJ30_18285 [Acidobacteria bacterium]|nr:hypothetical protein [Acidobacteriota bacterium]